MVSEKLETYWREAMQQPAHKVMSKTDQMLQRAGLLPTENDPLSDPLFLPDELMQYRENIRRQIANWKGGGPFQDSSNSTIIYGYNDPVGACRKLDRNEQESIWRAQSAGQPLSMATWQYVECQERLCYEMLTRGAGEREIAARTNLDVLEVREIANRHGIITHL